jgi:hypothetical protein
MGVLVVVHDRVTVAPEDTEIGPSELLAFKSTVGATALTVTEQLAVWAFDVTVTVLLPVVDH